MILVSVYYPRSASGRFDHQYYEDQHFDLIRRSYGERLKGYAALQMRDDQLDAEPSPNVAAAHFLFESKRDFVDAFDEHREAIIADIQRFTDIEPVIEIGHVQQTSVDDDGHREKEHNK